MKTNKSKITSLRLSTLLILASLTVSGCVYDDSYSGLYRNSPYLGYDSYLTDYYFYPSAGVYYHPTSSNYYYLDGPTWSYSRWLPSHIYLNDYERVYLKARRNRPYDHYHDHKKRYRDHKYDKKVKKPRDWGSGDIKRPIDRDYPSGSWKPGKKDYPSGAIRPKDRDYPSGSRYSGDEYRPGDRSKLQTNRDLRAYEERQRKIREGLERKEQDQQGWNRPRPGQSGQRHRDNAQHWQWWVH